MKNARFLFSRSPFNFGLLLAALCSLAITTQGAFDAFLKLDGVPGESTDSKHKDEIEVASFSWGITQPAALVDSIGGGGFAFRAVFNGLNVTKRLDKATPVLYLNCASGKHIPTATLVLRKAGTTPVEYMKITLTDVIITSVQTSGAAGADVPAESVSLNFSKIQWEYIPQSSSGEQETPIKSGWDLKSNAKL